MKVGWVADNFYPNFIGGAEITDYLIIEASKKFGHQVDRLTVQSKFKGCDLLVLSNIHDFPEALVWTMMKENYVFFSHDPTVEPFYTALLNNSKLNIFLSPLHRDWYQQHFDNIGRTAVIPSPIEVDKCYPSKKKENYCAYIGFIVEHKGHLNIVQYAHLHPELEFHLFGRMGKDERTYSVSNLFYEGKVERDEVFRVLAESEYYIHLPVWMEAFGRSVVEAYLCGCKLIINGNVGCTSYAWWDKREKVLEKVNLSKYRFWTVIEEMFRNE